MNSLDFGIKTVESDSSFSDSSSSGTVCESKGLNTIGFVSPDPFYYISMVEHLSNIDSTILNKDQTSEFQQFYDEDYYLDQMNKKFVENPKKLLETVQCVLTVIAHPLQYPKINSDYSNKSSDFLEWKGINTSHLNDYPIVLQTTYKNDYQRLKPQIRYIPFVSPTPEKMNTMKAIRRESALGRVLFHYIGYGFPSDLKDSIGLSEGYNHENMVNYPVSKIFESFSQPSWFIFDSDNAGVYLDCLIKTSNEQKVYYKNNSHQDDWFCFCATSEGEVLPRDKCLPRDFLTSCLLTPIPISILCHILKYFRTSFPSSDFPLSNIEDLWESSNEFQLDLVLSAITDGIAADYVYPTSQYQLLFHQDSFISKFFKRFFLAQYLLSSYDVHPVSFPTLPNTVSHPLWQEWDASMDLWVMSNLVPKPSFASHFFARAATTMTTLLSLPKSRIDPSLLSILFKYPFSGVEGGDRAYILLFKYAFKSIENRKKIASIVKFNNLFTKLISHESNEKEYQSLAYLILSMLQLDLNYAYEVKKDLNLSILPSYLFDEKNNELTRSLLAAILSSVVPALKTIRTICASSEFILAVKDTIRTAENPLLILWLLILLKRSFSVLSADFSLFYKDSSHIQVSVCLFHKMHEIRAAAASSLSCFMQSNECDSNIQLILFSISAFNDMSYLVRYQLLLLLVRFLSSSTSSTGQIDLNNVHSFNDIFISFLKTNPKTFEDFAKAIDEICHLDDSFSHVACIVNSLILYFIHDPHPSISSLAIRAHQSFSSKNNSDALIQSFSPPFMSLVLEGETFEEELIEAQNIDSFESDSDALFNIALRRIVHLQENENNGMKKTRNETTFGAIPFPSVSLRLETSSNHIKGPISKIVFEQSGLRSVVISNKKLYSLRENHTIASSLQIEKSDISDLHIINSSNDMISVISTYDGCGYIWNPTYKNVSAAWRVDPNYTNNNIPLYNAVSSINNTVAMGRWCSGLSLWDISSQKLIGEWLLNQTNKISSLAMSPSDNNICIVGYENGNCIAIDTRCPNSIRNFSIGECIIGIKGNRSVNDSIFLSTVSGRILQWDLISNEFTPIEVQKTTITSFDAHYALPLLSISSKTSVPLILSSTSGEVLYKATEFSPDTVVSFHPTLPVISFGTSTGELFSYDILQS